MFSGAAMSLMQLLLLMLGVVAAIIVVWALAVLVRMLLRATVQRAVRAVRHRRRGVG